MLCSPRRTVRQPENGPIELARRVAALVVVVVAACLVAGCARDEVTPTAPSTGGADKRPCPALAVTYADPNTIDGWWSGGVKDFSVVAGHGGYHVFHITDPATGWLSRGGELTFGHAFSLDLARWHAQERIALRTGPGGWSPSFVWAPHVIRVEDEGLWYMFYTGVKWGDGAPHSSAEQRVGLATSPDLFHWTRYDADGQDGLILDGPDHEQHPWSAFDTDHAELPWEFDCRDPFVFDRGPDHTSARWVMLNSVRLAPDAEYMAVAYATSDDLLTWTWQHYFPVTVGWTAESANLLEHAGNHYLFWTDRGSAPAVRVARSTSGVLGDYQLIDEGEPIFGLANETLRVGERTLYLAIDDGYHLHVKAGLLLPSAPDPGEPVRVVDFTECGGAGIFADRHP